MIDGEKLCIKLPSNFFSQKMMPNYTQISVSKSTLKVLGSDLAGYLRKFYISDRKCNLPKGCNEETKRTKIRSSLPDPGAVMAGDFGEFMVYLYQESSITCDKWGPVKWRLKLDRQKPMPHSDVVHFITPDWPSFGSNDKIVCSEVKTKSLPGKFDPLTSAIKDSNKDKTSRLAKTIVWLSEKNDTSDKPCNIINKKLKRFKDTVENPVFSKEFRAVVVFCKSLQNEISDAAKNIPHPDSDLYLVSIPDLKSYYEKTYEMALTSLP